MSTGSLFINRHARWPVNTQFFKNNVKYARQTKDLKRLVKKHNYYLLDFPAWKIKALKRLGRKYMHKFKHAPRKRKFFKRTVGYFSFIVQSLSGRAFSTYHWKNNYFLTRDDYKNTPKYKLFFFKQAAKKFVLKNRRIKYFRKKITIRRVFAKRFGITSNQKFYHAHKKFKNKKNSILRWINEVELRLPQFIFNLGWAQTIQIAKFMANDGYILLNGARVPNRMYTRISLSDNLAIPKKLYKFNYRRYARLYRVRYGFIDWYRGLHLRRRHRREFFNSYTTRVEGFFKKFWSTRTFEWKLSVLEKLKKITRFSGTKLFDASRKKISVSLRNNFNKQNFLPMYKMHELAVNRKLIDFFLHNHYF